MYKKHRMTKIMRCRWDRLLLLSKTVLGAVFQALDVRAVQPDDHSGHKAAADRAEHNRRHACAVRDEVDEGTDRVQSSDDNTAKRDDMGNRNLDQENNQQDCTDERFGGKRRTGAHQNALAAFEVVIERKNVSQNGEDAGDIADEMHIVLRRQPGMQKFTKIKRPRLTAATLLPTSPMVVKTAGSLP